MVLLVGTVVLVGALTFVPRSRSGPIVEHLQLLRVDAMTAKASSVDQTAPTSARPLFDRADRARARCVDAFGKLDPRRMIRNPVMFVVEVGSVFTTVLFVHALVDRRGEASPGFIARDLALAVVHGAVRELRRGDGRGPRQGPGRHAAQGAQGRHGEASSPSRGATRAVDRACRRRSCAQGDLVLVEAGEFIPGDGEIIEGVASVDESAITGESAPVIRESGGDRSAVTGGTRVLSDWLDRRASPPNPGETFLDRMIAMVEGAKRKKTPNEIALDILLAGADDHLPARDRHAAAVLALRGAEPRAQGTPVTLTVLVALLVCLIPTTIGGLLSAIGIAGMDRMIQANVIATSGRAVEAAGDVDVLLLDKTGTITLGNRQATAFLPAPGVTEARARRRRAARLARRRDARGHAASSCSAKEKFGLRGRDVHELGATFVPFTAQTRMSGVDLDGRADPQGRGRRDRSATSTSTAARCPPRCARSGRRRRQAGRDAARRRRRQRACSASSSSRTSSRAASRSGSPSCAAWASRP